jgi:hypothetical protein
MWKKLNRAAPALSKSGMPHSAFFHASSDSFSGPIPEIYHLELCFVSSRPKQQQLLFVVVVLEILGASLF